MSHKNKIHGLHGHRVYHIWRSMKARCEAPSNTAYRSYGAKGVKYAPAWKDFIAFIEDMGLPPSPDFMVAHKVSATNADLDFIDAISAAAPLLLEIVAAAKEFTEHKLISMSNNDSTLGITPGSLWAVTKRLKEALANLEALP